ncbi:hypothetical protein Tco_1115650, partial [Tanacetum coccineum]
MSFQLDSGLAVPVFTQGDDPIACLNKAMAFLSAVASLRFPSTIINLELPLIRETRPQFKTAGLLSNKFKGGKDKVMLVLDIKVMLLVPREIMKETRQGLLNVIIIKESSQILDEEQLAFLVDLGILDIQATHTIIPNNVAFQTEDLDAYDSDCNDISTAQAVLMANLSNYGLDVILE